MIEPERVLIVLSALTAEAKMECLVSDVQRMFAMIYRFSHIGTEAINKCKHPEWIEEFLQIEKKLIDRKVIPSIEKTQAKLCA